MRFEIQCSNFSEFDPQSGKYVRCGGKAAVSSEQVGQFVSCKKCGQQIEVVARSASPSASVAQKPITSRAKSVQKSARKTHQDRPASFDFQRGDSQFAAPLKGSKTDIMSMNFGDEQDALTLREDQQDRCTKCGNISKSGKCTVCHHVERSFHKRNHHDNGKIKLVGFQRWFCKNVGEGISIKVLEMGTHVSLGFIAMALALLSIISLFGFAFGTLAGIIVLLLTIGASLLYINLVIKGRSFVRDPEARVAWYQKPFWHGILVIARAMNWQNYDSNLKDRQIIKPSDRSFGDNDLAKVDDLKTCQVLDLEGTQVTDTAIQMLYGHSHLRCLVLKGTQTTHQAVFRFQQAHPRVWIWE